MEVNPESQRLSVGVKPWLHVEGRKVFLLYCWLGGQGPRNRGLVCHICHLTQSWLKTYQRDINTYCLNTYDFKACRDGSIGKVLARRNLSLFLEQGLFFFFKARLGAWGIAQWLRACVALREGLGLVPSAYTHAHSHLQLQFQEIWCLLLTSLVTRHLHGVSKTPVHVK